MGYRVTARFGFPVLLSKFVSLLFKEQTIPALFGNVPDNAKVPRSNYHPGQAVSLQKAPTKIPPWFALIASPHKGARQQRVHGGDCQGQREGSYRPCEILEIIYICPHLKDYFLTFR